MEHPTPVQSFVTGFDLEKRSFTWTIGNSPLMRKHESAINFQRIEFTAGETTDYSSKWAVYLQEIIPGDGKRWIGIFLQLKGPHPTEDWTLPALTSLTFYSSLSICNLRKLLKWMPNLEYLLGIRLDDVKFSMVCKFWRKLKRLADCGKELTDEGVLGIGYGHGGVNEAGPNITKLNLTSFSTNSSKLTSASVYNGLLKLPNLDLEWILLGESTKLDEEAKVALKKDRRSH